jgi:hypothetical protein
VSACAALELVGLGKARLDRQVLTAVSQCSK